MKVRTVTATAVPMIPARSGRVARSVPADSACTVVRANSGKLRKWVARHSRLERRRRSSDVTSTATRK